jgi:dihydrodipicolinate synthase/N-acetylneuraminate lyase
VPIFSHGSQSMSQSSSAPMGADGAASVVNVVYPELIRDALAATARQRQRATSSILNLFPRVFKDRLVGVTLACARAAIVLAGRRRRVEPQCVLADADAVCLATERHGGMARHSGSSQVTQNGDEYNRQLPKAAECIS